MRHNLFEYTFPPPIAQAMQRAYNDYVEGEFAGEPSELKLEKAGDMVWKAVVIRKGDSERREIEIDLSGDA